MTFASPITFYENECNVTSEKKYCTDAVETYSLFMPLGTITPFMINVSSLSIGSVVIKSAKTGYVATVTSFFNITDVGGIQYQAEDTYSPTTSVTVRSSIYAVGGTSMTFAEYVRQHGDVFYLLLISGGSTVLLYSDIFEIKDLAGMEDCVGCDPYIIIEWSNTCNLGELKYADIAGLNNKVYLNTAMSKPEYEYNEEGDEDGRGEFYAKFKSIKKIRKAELMGTEGLADALAFIPLHDTIHITDTDGNEYSTARFLTSVSWQNDCLATVSISSYTAFTTKTNCC